MPLVRVSMLKGRTPEQIKLISESIHSALVEAFGMHQDDRFQILEQLEPDVFLFDRHYMTQTPRSDEFLIIHIKAGAGDATSKEALYRALVLHLEQTAGVHPQDVLVTLDVNPALENWSFGNGLSLANGF